MFVFDGATPAIKRRTVIARRQQREQAGAKLRRTAEKLLLARLKCVQMGYPLGDRIVAHRQSGIIALVQISDLHIGRRLLAYIEKLGVALQAFSSGTSRNCTSPLIVIKAPFGSYCHALGSG